MMTLSWRYQWTTGRTMPPHRRELALLADYNNNNISRCYRIKKFLRTSAPHLEMEMVGELT